MSTVPAGALAEPAPAERPKSASMSAFIVDLVRPYRGWLAIVFAAMLVQTAMSLAGPWPIKVIIDNVVSGHPLPEWLCAGSATCRWRRTRWASRCWRRSPRC